MAYLLRFGSYDFPETLRPADENGGQDQADQPRPRGSGSVTQEGRREKTILQVRGELTADTPDELDALHQALKAACYAGKQDLYLGRDDRYYKDAQLKSFGTTYNEGLTYGVWAAYSLTFEAAAHPEAFDALGSITTTLSATGGTVTNEGDAPTLPTWTITLGGAGSGPITLTNSTTGETATLSGALSGGDVIALSRDGYTVTRNNVAEFGLMDGRIPRLAAGNNVVALTASGGVTVAALAVAYTPRFH